MTSTFVLIGLELISTVRIRISVLPSSLAISIAMRLRLSSTFFMTSEIATEVGSDVAWSGVLHSA